MKTAIGVFPNRARAEEAMRQLLQRRVPLERITFLTRSESDASGMAKLLHGSTPQSAALEPARSSVLAISGVGSVLTQGPDVRDLVDPASPVASSGALAKLENPSAETHRMLPAEDDDAAFFRRALNDGCSVIVVRSDSSVIATAACEVLDKLSLGVPKAPKAKSGVTVRQIPGAVVAAFSGKIALDDGCQLLRETIRALLDGGQLRILLNLEHLDFLDSAGLGELVRTHIAVRSRGGQLTLVNPAPNVSQLLRITKVDRTFDIAPDELTALTKGR